MSVLFSKSKDLVEGNPQCAVGRIASGLRDASLDDPTAWPDGRSTEVHEALNHQIHKTGATAQQAAGDEEAPSTETKDDAPKDGVPASKGESAAALLPHTAHTRNPESGSTPGGDETIRISGSDQGRAGGVGSGDYGNKAGQEYGGYVAGVGGC